LTRAKRGPPDCPFNAIVRRSAAPSDISICQGFLGSLQQLARRIRLGQDRALKVKQCLLDGLVAVAGREQDAQVRIGDIEPLHQLGAGHLRHDQIGDHEIDRLAGLTNRAQSLLAMCP
jgi:hypothetical protein